MIYSWGIIGHDKQLFSLEREIISGQLPHAYLFHGPKDTGKFSVAFTLAKILLCKNRLCHQCHDCQMVKSGSHPDLVIFRDQDESITIDEVRHLIYKTNLTSQGGLRIVLIENLERMPVEAQNSFLKTLEEPPGNTLFLMTSGRIKKILPTILSRVRQQPFFLIQDEIMRCELASRFAGHDDLEEVLQMAQGRPGLAIKLLSDPPRFSIHKGIYNQIECMLKNNDIPGKFAFAESLEEKEDQWELFFDIFSQIIRKSIYDFMRSGKSLLSPRYNLSDIVGLFENLLKTRYFIDRNANKKLALENFLLSTEK